MDFSEAAQWWEEWQLRVLVLSSLFLQYFLYFAAPLRKRYIPPWFRFIIWLAYLGSDAVAIYALAALFNRHKKQEWVSTHRDDACLEALWAPILLVHIGGVDTITAYNIEDNELWRRHVLTSVSQAVVAIYVFHKSWSGDKRLLQAAILIFLVGILKCFEKPVALKSASISSLMSIRSSSITDEPEHMIRLEDDDGKEEEYRRGRIAMAIISWNDEMYYPFVDMAPSRRRRCSHQDLQSYLSLSFNRLYTKEQVSSSTLTLIGRIMDSERVGWRRICGWLLRTVLNPMMLTALGLFHRSHRGAYSNVDVKVTYALLSCTASLEYVGALWFVLGFMCHDSRSRQLPHYLSWPDHIAQYNLIGYLASNKKHWILRSIAAFLGYEDYLDPLWCMKPCKSSSVITDLVCGYIKTWKNDEHGSKADPNRAFNDNRGHWSLKKLGCGGTKILGESLRMPFDKSVLLWHLATEFCFYDTDTPPAHIVARRCRVMSNYMAYLLFINPEMLMTGARPSVFRDEYKRLIEGMPLDDAEPAHETRAPREEELAKKIIQNLKSRTRTQGEEGVADDAWALSKHLMDLCKGDREKMWKVIEGVWVEMLCFSASRCRGYLHAKSLGKGGEYLSYIWLLLWRMGVETLADKMQKAPELQQQRDDCGGGDNEKTEPQEKEDSNGGAGCTTPATTITGDKKTDGDGSSHCTASGAPPTAVIGDDENV